MSFRAVDIGQTPSAASIVFEALRRAIIHGELAEGAPLRQEEIARAFNTSRIPVREAIARLEQIGLVETRRFRGAVVAPIPVEEVDEIFDLRALVEADAVRRAVPMLAPETLAEARAAHAAFAAATDPEAWTVLNRRFHRLLCDGGRSPNYLAVLDRLLDRLDRYLRAQLKLTDGMGRAVREHAALLEAAEAGEADRAAALAFEHVQGAKTALLDHLRATRRDAGP